MVDGKLLEAVKAGLKGELDSVTVYMGAAEAASGEVADFFRNQATEEKKHYNWLLSYYHEILAGTIPNRNLAAEVFEITQRAPFVNETFLRRVGESQYLVTAVASAVLLESNAVRHYRAAAEVASGAELKNFFETLAKWEEKHYEDLLKIQDESRQYWFDAQNFEPF